jgi:hypothetical protein
MNARVGQNLPIHVYNFPIVSGIKTAKSLGKTRLTQMIDTI